MTFLPLGSVFVLIGSVMAFLITYEEYSRHYREKGKALRAALRTGMVALLFFSALTLAALVLIGKMLRAN